MVSEDSSLLTTEQVPESLRTQAAQRSGFREEYPFESRWFRTSAGVQHYVDEGSGPVLLMVHGNPTWSFAWRRLIVALRDRFRIIAIDHLGCGFSEKPQDRDEYVLARHIERVSALVRLLGLHDISLFAHDWGGAIGMGCAARMPERFSRFVLMNTGAFRSQAIPFRIALCRIPLLGEIADRGLNLFARAAQFMTVEKKLDRSVRTGFIAPYNSWNNRIAVHQFVQDIPLNEGHRSWKTLCEVEDGLRQFQDHPVQLIWGMKDWCFTPEEFLSGFVERFPKADVLPIADAGHYVFEDAFERLLHQVNVFLKANGCG